MSTGFLLASTLSFPMMGEPRFNPLRTNLLSEDPERRYEARKPKIIVVDDESLIAETVVEILRDEGFEAMAVASGASAVELAETWLPDIILSDVIMPGLNGIETAVKIRDIVPSCKIILFSGQAATVDLLEQARRDGHLFEVLAKPIKPEQLISMVRTGSTEPS